MPKENTHKPTVAVLGASRDPRKFGYRSVVAHVKHGYEVFPINPGADEIAGLKAFASLDDLPVEQVDRVTVYLPPHVAIELLGQIAAKKPTEVWFNPGSESEELLTAAQKIGLPVITACSLIDLASR